MRRLLGVEIKRLLARRLFRLVVVLGLLGVLVVDGIIAARSNTDVAAAKAKAVRIEQQSYDSCISFAAAGNGGPTKAECDSQRPAAQMQQCRTENPVHPDQDCSWILNEYYQDPRFHFAEHAKDLLTGTAYILMMVGPPRRSQCGWCRVAVRDLRLAADMGAAAAAGARRQSGRPGAAHDGGDGRPGWCC